MTDATRFQFDNPSVPKAYDEFLVPRLFEPWAKLLLDEAELRPGASVLDIATGPGTVARLAAVCIGAKGRVVATGVADESGALRGIAFESSADDALNFPPIRLVFHGRVSLRD